MKENKLIFILLFLAVLTTLYNDAMSYSRNDKKVVRSRENIKIEQVSDVKQEKQIEVIEKPKVVKKETNLMCSSSSVKTYMSYKAITSKSSAQYRFIKANMTVNEKGLLVDKDGYIGVALSSRYGKIGTKYKITLNTGIILNVVKVDEKSVKHTDKNNCVQKWDGSFMEMVIDVKIASKYYGLASNGYVLSGNFNNSKDFKGNIKSVVLIK